MDDKIDTATADDAIPLLLECECGQVDEEILYEELGLLAPAGFIADQNAIKLLLDTEFISIKNQNAGVIFRVGLLLVNKQTNEHIYELDLWINYNLHRMFRGDKSRWCNQLRWLNSSLTYNGGYEIRPVFRFGYTLTYVKAFIKKLVDKYQLDRVYFKDPSATDFLVIKDLNVAVENIIAPKYDGVHHPLAELIYFSNFIS